jgi:hypothetical protein
VSESKNTRILICPHRGNETPHTLLFEHEYNDTFYNKDGSPSEGPDPPSVYSLFECGTCHNISLYDGIAPAGFGRASLVYPQGIRLHKSVPNSVASNFEEAKRIQKISPNGFAVSVRRALEAMCSDRAVPAGTLAKRLAVLADKGEIPPVLAEMTSVLRSIGNSGAHNTTQTVTVPMTWAMDEFFRALVEYVYIGPFRLKQFRKRSGLVGETEKP